MVIFKSIIFLMDIDTFLKLESKSEISVRMLKKSISKAFYGYMNSSKIYNTLFFMIFWKSSI